MAAKSHWFENVILDSTFKGGTFPDFTSSNDLYLALFTDLPSGDTPPSSEVSGNAYARVALKAKFASSTISAVSSGSEIKNSADITFAVASGGAWGNIQSMCIMDASTGGNVLFYGTFAQAKQIYDGDQFKVTTNSLTIKED